MTRSVATLAAAALALAGCARTVQIEVEPVAHGAHHPAVTVPAAGPGTTAYRWRDGCDTLGEVDVWLQRGAASEPVYLPDFDSDGRTELPGPVSCSYPHTAADRDALDQELTAVAEARRWQWRDRWGYGP